VVAELSTSAGARKKMSVEYCCCLDCLIRYSILPPYARTVPLVNSTRQDGPASGERLLKLERKERVRSGTTVDRQVDTTCPLELVNQRLTEENLLASTIHAVSCGQTVKSWQARGNWKVFCHKLHQYNLRQYPISASSFKRCLHYY